MLRYLHWNDISFGLVDLKTLRAVSKLIEMNHFNCYLQVKIVEMSIAKLLRFEEEEEEEEEEVSDEEMCQRWHQVMSEARETAQNLLQQEKESRKENLDVFSAFKWNLYLALTTPSLVQMAKSNKYKLEQTWLDVAHKLIETD